MVNKKYLLLAGLCSVMLTAPVSAQESSGQEGASQYTNRDMTYRGESYDVLDSTYVPKHRREQHRKYLNHQYAFPAKPKSMWEIGVGAGLYNVDGDVPSMYLWENTKGGYGFHGHVRKSWGYTISTRLQYIYGVGQGMNYRPATNHGNNPAWNGENNGYQYQPMSTVFYNYRTEAHQLNLDLIATTNNIRFHRGKVGVAFYGYVGVGANAYQTWVNALQDNTTGYEALYASVYSQYLDPNTGQISYKDRKNVIKDLLDGMDETYETAAETEANNRRIFNDRKTLNWVGSVGAGTQIKFSKRVNLSIEHRITAFAGGEDLVDGQRWAEQVGGSPVVTVGKDMIHYTSLGLNFNIGSKRNVEPLYWLNPLDHVYGELSAPRHMKLPEPILSDADGDGIADQFDKCPGTPEGVAVDSHGCPLDTDGDGVPDYLDKQLITPTECQPVDADGVGECPCNCDAVAAPCSNISAGNITFSGSSRSITAAMKTQLATLAAQMQANPTCKIVLIGQGNASKVQQQRSWDRVNAIQEYMSDNHGVDRNRFIFQYGQPGDPNSVMYRAAQAGEDGPSTVAPPHPQLSNQR